MELKELLAIPIEGIERMANPALGDEFQRSACQLIKYVYILRFGASEFV